MNQGTFPDLARRKDAGQVRGLFFYGEVGGLHRLAIDRECDVVGADGPTTVRPGDRRIDLIFIRFDIEAHFVDLVIRWSRSGGIYGYPGYGDRRSRFDVICQVGRYEYFGGIRGKSVFGCLCALG